MTNKKLKRRNKFIYNCRESLEMDEKVPRKVKKFILGPKQSRNRIHKMIEDIEILSKVRTNGYVEYYPSKEFCPHCGCNSSYSGGNLAVYPEVWETLYCLRCNNIVAEANNSAMTHVLVYLKNTSGKGRNYGYIRNTKRK